MNFGLIGAAGYIAPKHMRAIKENGGSLLAIMDPNDSVGVIDSHFPDSLYFSEIESFDRHIYRSIGTSDKIDYISVCSPNYLHDSHIRLGLRNDCDVICEKPLVINPENIKYLEKLEAETGRKVSTVLQLRYHSQIVELKKAYKNVRLSKPIDLSYVTCRGNWYMRSWKGDLSKSGGLAANIGIHFFDMLSWVFGDPVELCVKSFENKSISGTLKLDRAEVNWLLSIDENNIPKDLSEKGIRAYRSLSIDGKEIDFSKGFKDLHTVAYKNIISGNGFGLSDALPSLIVCSDISKGIGTKGY
tara:strand:- start:1422 stop:2324 length:903 start_codon:yes stop_codon:yes gene_type:complete